MPPTTYLGPTLLLGNPDPTHDRIVMGRHRSDPGASSVRHDPAGASRRVDRSWCVRPTPRRSNQIVRSHLTEVAIDGSLHKAPYGGEGTGKRPVDRGKLGWKWSIGVDRHGVPLGWAIDGANRNDVRLLEPTLDAIAAGGWTGEIETMHLDRGYDYPKIRRQLIEAGLPDHVIQRRRQPGDHRPKTITLGLRWIVEATNSWLSNYGQLRRNTDRKICHRHAAICLAVTVLIVGKLLTYRDRHCR